MQGITGKRVLVSPLDWGWGHAARCVPVIRNLIHAKNEVIVFAGRDAADFLSQRFPSVKIIYDRLPDFSYGKRGMGTVQQFLLALKLAQRTRRERKTCEELIRQFQIDLVISDNRYGFHSVNVPSVLMTHQLEPRLPSGFRWSKNLVYRYLNRKYSCFTEIWVPDLAEAPGLAGALSHPEKMPAQVKYIGWLSRFNDSLDQNPLKGSYALLITSGPQRHRKHLAESVLPVFQKWGIPACVAGVEPCPHLNAQFFPSPDDQTLARLISEARLIVAHSGYSLLMDLLKLKRTAVVLPTQGQTEQMYLADLNQHIFPKANDIKELEEMVGRLLNDPS